MTINRVAVELWPGCESMGHELTSDLVSVTIADLGAHLASVVLRLAEEQELQINVGYPHGNNDFSGFHGASVGRYANRIAGAQFDLDGVTHELESNEGPNQLHGGADGFHGHAWSADAEVDGETGRVVLRHTSKAGAMGFPGKLKATAIFELTGNQLRIDFRAKASEPTPVNLTNHVYWNLGTTGTLAGHDLVVAAPTYVQVDPANIPLDGPPVPVIGSRFDCTEARPLGQVIDDGGYDHCFVLDGQAQVAASLLHDSGRRIDMTTNQVGLQVYTGQHLDPAARGIALETQCLPDTPNRADFGDCTVRPGDNYLASTTLTFHA